MTLKEQLAATLAKLNARLETRTAAAAPANTTAPVVKIETSANGRDWSADVKTMQDRVKTLEDQLRARPTTSAVSASGVDWKKLSIAKWMLALIDRAKVGDRAWEMHAAGAEKEAHDYVYKTMSSVDPGLGGFLVTPELQQALIEPLRNALVMPNLPVLRLTGLVGSPVPIPRQTADGTGYWVAEGANVTRSDPTVDEINLYPHAAGAATQLNNALLRRSPGAAEKMVRESIVAVLERLKEKAFFEGSGASGQPLGLQNVSGINTVSALSGNANAKLALLQGMIEEIEVDNGNTAGLQWVMHSRVWHEIVQWKLALSTGTDSATLTSTIPMAAYPGIAGIVNNGQERSLLGYPVRITNNLTASTTSIVTLADFSDTVFAEWGMAEVKVTDEGQTLRLANQTLFTALQEVDCAARHPVSICTGVFTY